MLSISPISTNQSQKQSKSVVPFGTNVSQKTFDMVMENNRLGKLSDRGVEVMEQFAADGFNRLKFNIKKAMAPSVQKKPIYRAHFTHKDYPWKKILLEDSSNVSQALVNAGLKKTKPTFFLNINQIFEEISNLDFKKFIKDELESPDAVKKADLYLEKKLDKLPQGPIHALTNKAKKAILKVQETDPSIIIRDDFNVDGSFSIFSTKYDKATDPLGDAPKADEIKRYLEELTPEKVAELVERYIKPQAYAETLEKAARIDAKEARLKASFLSKVKSEHGI